MKRLISLILIFVMLFSLFPAEASAQEPETDRPVIDEAGIQQALDYAQAHGYQELPAPEDDPSDAPAPAVRAPLEDNLVTPAPLMEGLAATKGNRVGLPLIRHQTGKTGQNYAVLIFKGKQTTGKPVETLIGSFTNEAGMFEDHVYWDTAKAAYGTYTVVTCTVVSANGGYNIIAGTAFAEDIDVVDFDIYPTGYYLVDENGKRVNKICSDGSEPLYYYIKHEPAIVTHFADVSVLGNMPAKKYEYHGLVVVEPTDHGWGTLDIDPININIEITHIDVEVCVNKDGHSAAVQTLLRNPSKKFTGATLSYCPDCNTSNIAEAKTTYEIFQDLHDLPRDAWYFASAKEAILRGLFKGVSKNRFYPNDTMTRAMLVTVLWRYAGSPKEGKNTFSDVKAGQWYTDAVAWAAKNHIVDGVGGGKFDPDGKITREQMAAILYRYAGSNGIDTSARGELSGFVDSAKVSSWAHDAMQWCVAEGFIGGTKVNGTLLLDPQGSATRAQVSAILVRFIEKTDPAEQVVPLNPTDAEDSGSFSRSYVSENAIDWAFFPDGTLVFAGDATIPAGGTPSSYTQQTTYDMPWDKYTDRVKNIKILNGVTSIGIAAFRGYPNLETVEMPDSITYIYDEAFKNCTSLKNIRWPQTTLSIGNEAFSGCTALEEVVLPEGVYKCLNAFKNCTGLKKIVFSDSLIDSMYNSPIGNPVEGCTSLTDVRLPLGMKSLPSGFFRNCSSLETVEFPLGMYYIDNSVFEGCASLKTLVLPFHIRYILDEAFQAEKSFQESGYVDTCGLTDLFILNPLFGVGTRNTSSDGTPLYTAPFGNKENVTVHAYAGTKAAALAQEMGYRFEPLNK